MEQDEHLLIEKILNGDKEAFRVIIQKYKRLVFHIIFRMVSNKTEREDLGQEIFIKIYDNLRKFKGNSSLTTWISAIAHNTCKNYLKKKKTGLYEDILPKVETDDENQSPAESIAAKERELDETISVKEIYDILNREIFLLPVLYREILSLYYLEQLSYKEISAIVKLPEGTIKNYMFRARAILKQKLMMKYQLEEI